MIRRFDEWFIVHVWIRAWVAIHNAFVWFGMPESWTEYCIGRVIYALETYEPKKGSSDD